MDKKGIIRKLKMYKRDLSDDGFLINSINMEIDSLKVYFEAGVKSDNIGSISDKIVNLSDATQQSDANISNAESNIQYEIDAVEKEIEQEAEAKKAAIDAKIASLKASILGKLSI